MRNKLLLLLTFFATELANCQNKFDINKIKDEDFKKYVSLFPEEELPFSTLKEIEITYHNLDRKIVDRFICMDTFCLKDWSGYDIEFSPYVYLPSNGDYVILIHDESTEGGTIRKLTTYDYYGNKIAQLEIFAEKPFHGDRGKDEISHYEIESEIDENLVIKKKYFEKSSGWKEDDKRFFYGRYIEYVYKIDTDGKIALVSEKDHGRKKYIGGRLDPSVFPRWKVYQE